MNKSIDQIKKEILHPSCQVVLFHPTGQLIDSCQTLLNIDQQKSLYQQFDFLESLQDVLPQLNLNEPLAFDWVEWQEQVEGLFQMSFERVSADEIQWFIFDKRGDEAQIRAVQQSRNEATINEEFLDLQKKYLEAEKELLSLKNEELKRIQAFKQRFFAEVSHEMRTPLNNISGLARLIRKEPYHHEYLQALISTSKHLNHIINDVLDLVKIEENKLLLEEEHFQLKTVLDNVFQGFFLTARKKNLDLNFTLKGDIPSNLKGDPVRLAQILYNVLGNAIKFTDQGGISLNVECTAQTKDQVKLIFTLVDTGKGMTRTDQQSIMQPFVQAKGQKVKDFGGTGLGMGIVQGLIKVMSGSFQLESELGQGTVVTFALPFAKGKQQDRENEIDDKPDFSSFQVLCAEDDPVSALIMEEHLSEWEMKYTMVSKISELKQALDNSSFDLLITDMSLEDGHALSHLLAWQIERPELANLPIIFVSGEAREEHPELAQIKKAFYVVKPLQPEVLLKRIQQALKTKEHTNTLPTLDLSALKKAAQNDTQFVQELIQTILEVLPKDMAILDKAIKDSDNTKAVKLLHKMKPSISYMGVDEIIRLQKSLRQSIIQGDSGHKDFPYFRQKLEAALEALIQVEEFRS